MYKRQVLGVFGGALSTLATYIDGEYGRRYYNTARRLYELAEAREAPTPKPVLKPGTVAVIDDYIALMREKGDHFFGVQNGATLSNAAKGFIGAGGFDWWVDAFTIRTLALIIKRRPLGSSSRYEIAARRLEEIAETRANRSLYAPA